MNQEKAECPYCHKDLNKVPKAKTKCPHCGNFMYVRTRLDRTRVIATQEEADKIKKDWESLAQEQQAADVRDRMENSFEINRANIEAWRQSGVVKELRSINSGRETVCKYCAAQAEKIISIAEARVGINMAPFFDCLNLKTTGCCCASKPIVDTTISS